MLADIINEKRKKKKLSQLELSKLTNLSIQEIVNLERYETTIINLDIFNKIKDILDLDDEFRKKYVSKYNTYSEILTKKRIDKNLSRKDVANIIGVKPYFIYKLESNIYKKINYQTYLQLKPVLDLNDEEFRPFILNNDTLKVDFIDDGTFGDLVKEKRIKLGLNQNDLAIKCNTSYTLISKIESKTRKTTFKTAYKIMQILYFTKDEIKKYCPNHDIEVQENDPELLIKGINNILLDKIENLNTEDKINALRKAIELISELSNDAKIESINIKVKEK